MLSIRLTEEAEADLDEAALWYETQLNGLGKEFLDAFEHCTTGISEQPHRFPAVHRNVHRAFLPRFPYGVFFVIADFHIQILAVFHASRAPRVWQDRT